MLRASYYVQPTELDQTVFEKVIPADHFLKKVKEHIDFEVFRTVLASCYNPKEGRPADDPVLMLKLGYLAFQYNLSDRRVMAEAQVNIAFRFFLDLSLDSQLPHHSLMSLFRTRLGEDKYKEIFTGIVEQARSLGLVKDRLRLKDATHVIANIALPSTIQLVAQTRQRLLEALTPFAAERVQQERERATAIRTATSDLQETEQLLQRVNHLREIVTWGDLLWQGLPKIAENQKHTKQAKDQETLEEALRLAHKVLADRDNPNAPDKLLSLVDPDARAGKHGEFFDGYYLDVAMDADSQIVTALSILPASGNEAADATALIKQEEAAHHNDVAALSIDNAGFRGELLREWQDPEGLNLDVYVPPSAIPDPKGLFVSDDFVLEDEGKRLVCPGGEETTRRDPNRHGTGPKFTFPLKVCANCALSSQCLPPGDRTRGRQVVKNDYTAEYKAARAKAETDAYKAVRREHPRIERKLAEFVRRHGGRHARYWGRQRVNIQYLMIGMAINIKRIVRLVTTPMPSPAQQVA
jgi:transposase/phage-related protein